MANAQVVESIPSFCPSLYKGRKLTEFDQSRLWAALNEEPSSPSRHILEKLKKESVFSSAISVRHLNRLRVRWGMSRSKGRPRGRGAVQTGPAVVTAAEFMYPVTFAGIHLFSAWIESQGGFAEIINILQERIAWYAEVHPEDDFALLHHKAETLLHRFQALFYAPLFGIGKLSEFDVKEHPLRTLIGTTYHSSTLNQFLGQLERIEAGEALMPVLFSDEIGNIGYVDGHMIAYWSRKSMHKGKITMLGRIMAGSQAVVAHNQDGQALFFEYYPPDIRMPRFIVDYCRKVMAATGIEVFVIDREANSVELAREFEAEGIGVLSMLDKNQYDGLLSWTVTEAGVLDDGSIVYTAQWAEHRSDDPRHFVLVTTPDRVLAYWATSRVKEVLNPLQWPDVYRQRTEVQEYRFKEMKAHGALDVNYGTKTIIGPDRHQQRNFDAASRAKEKAHKKILKKQQLLEQQQNKILDSLEKGHQIRLEQRQHRLVQLEQELQTAADKEKLWTEKINHLGSPKQREDRDFRKQTIMTLRTLLLENMLLIFLKILCENVQQQVSLECLLKLLFQRSGSCLETPVKIIYWINAAGLSAAYKNTLTTLGAGLNAMNLVCRGKPIHIYMKEVPP